MAECSYRNKIVYSWTFGATNMGQNTESATSDSRTVRGDSQAPADRKEWLVRGSMLLVETFLESPVQTVQLFAVKLNWEKKHSKTLIIREYILKGCWTSPSVPGPSTVSCHQWELLEPLCIPPRQHLSSCAQWLDGWWNDEAGESGGGGESYLKRTPVDRLVERVCWTFLFLLGWSRMKITLWHTWLKV